MTCKNKVLNFTVEEIWGLNENIKLFGNVHIVYNFSGKLKMTFYMTGNKYQWGALQTEREKQMKSGLTIPSLMNLPTWQDYGVNFNVLSKNPDH